ncbi:MAG TPA: hypothetical protein VMZ03_08505 [Chitinophagaceae bacterium]|nr:hypothetical protein [Chitinophagaceae bacterium]
MRYLPFYITLLVFTACQTASKGKKHILLNFDSISKELKKYDSSAIRSATSYEELLEKASDEGGPAQQLYYELTDFHGYYYDMRLKFIRFCGDSSGEKIPTGAEGNWELSRRFFSGYDHHKPDGISAFFHSALNKLKGFAKLPLLITRLDKLKEQTSAETLEKILLNAPPVAALTILDSYEKTLKDLEFDILDEYFRNR